MSLGSQRFPAGGRPPGQGGLSAHTQPCPCQPEGLSRGKVFPRSQTSSGADSRPRAHCPLCSPAALDCLSVDSRTHFPLCSGGVAGSHRRRWCWARLAPWMPHHRQGWAYNPSRGLPPARLWGLQSLCAPSWPSGHRHPVLQPFLVSVLQAGCLLSPWSAVSSTPCPQHRAWHAGAEWQQEASRRPVMCPPLPLRMARLSWVCQFLMCWVGRVKKGAEAVHRLCETASCTAGHNMPSPPSLLRHQVFSGASVPGYGQCRHREEAVTSVQSIHPDCWANCAPENPLEFWIMRTAGAPPNPTLSPSWFLGVCGSFPLTSVSPGKCFAPFFSSGLGSSTSCLPAVWDPPLLPSGIVGDLFWSLWEHLCFIAFVERSHGALSIWPYSSGTV